MAGDWSDLTKRVARGIAEVRKTTGSELVAESEPVPLAGRIAQPVIQPCLQTQLLKQAGAGVWS